MSQLRRLFSKADSKSVAGNRPGAIPPEREFLPAALALQATPPSPVGRLLAMELIALMIIAVLWTSFSRVDIHALAVGEIVPLGETKTIRAPRLGLVRKVLVDEGARVEKGQGLLAMDDSDEQSRREQLQAEIGQLEFDRVRLQALLRGVESATPDTPIPAAIDALPGRERQKYRVTLSAYLSQREMLLSRLARQRSETEAEQARLKGLQVGAALLERRHEDAKKLFRKQMAAEHDQLEAEQRVIERRYEIEAAGARLKMHRAELVETHKALENLLSTIRERWLSQLSQTRLRLSQSTIQLRQLESRIEDLLLRAPVSGVVQELRVHARDAVVDAAQPLLKLVPQPRVLAVSARLPERDAGFVKPGQTAKVKVDAFPYTRFGILEGVISGISTDTTDDRERVPGYRLRVALPQERLSHYARAAELVPGMRVSVEIRTGERRLIEFFLAPVLRTRSESLHER